MTHRHNRREFLEHLGVASTATMFGTRVLPLNAAASSQPRALGEPWDMSWLERHDRPRLEPPDLAEGLIDTFHEVHGSSDDQVRIIILARRGGTPLLLGDAVWEKFPVGEDRKMNDRDVADVKKEVFANLVPGTFVMPSGVFALMRAQNAGCAYMRGQ